MEFWVSWAESAVSVGHGLRVGENTFLTFFDPEPSPVTTVGFSTGFGATGNWIFGPGTCDVFYCIDMENNC